jgi:hypothetical protein
MTNNISDMRQLIACVDACLANASNDPVADVIIEDLYVQCIEAYEQSHDPSLRVALFALAYAMDAIESDRKPIDVNALIES